MKSIKKTLRSIFKSKKSQEMAAKRSAGPPVPARPSPSPPRTAIYVALPKCVSKYTVSTKATTAHSEASPTRTPSTSRTTASTLFDNEVPNLPTPIKGFKAHYINCPTRRDSGWMVEVQDAVDKAASSCDRQTIFSHKTEDKGENKTSVYSHHVLLENATAGPLVIPPVEHATKKNFKRMKAQNTTSSHKVVERAENKASKHEDRALPKPANAIGPVYIVDENNKDTSNSIDANKSYGIEYRIEIEANAPENHASPEHAFPHSVTNTNDSSEKISKPTTTQHTLPRPPPGLNPIPTPNTYAVFQSQWMCAPELSTNSSSQDAFEEISKRTKTQEPTLLLTPHGLTPVPNSNAYAAFQFPWHSTNPSLPISSQGRPLPPIPTPSHMHPEDTATSERDTTYHLSAVEPNPSPLAPETYQANHPAFPSDAEWDNLPEYWEVEHHPEYNTRYRRRALKQHTVPSSPPPPPPPATHQYIQKGPEVEGESVNVPTANVTTVHEMRWRRHKKVKKPAPKTKKGEEKGPKKLREFLGLVQEVSAQMEMEAAENPWEEVQRLRNTMMGMMTDMKVEVMAA